MFRGIIPGKRVASTDFGADIANVQVQGKENRTRGASVLSKHGAVLEMDKNNSFKMPATAKGKGLQGDNFETQQAFDKLLDDLQIPSTLRPKLDTMEASVKAAMLRSSHTLALVPPLPPTSPAITATPTKTPGVLRRTRSSNSLDSPRAALPLAYDFPLPPQTAGRAYSPLVAPGTPGVDDADMRPPAAPFMDGRASAPHSYAHHARGASLDVPRSASQTHVPAYSKSDLGGAKLHKDRGIPKDIAPSKFCSILTSRSSLQLEVESVKKLRLLLRNESASWTESFLQQGGYAALLTRLNEILEVEWREEQHDDQVLHELLRCFKALSTSSAGCFALRSSCPTPFTQLISLLYSDKKPGELCTRQLIVELLLILFDLYPPSALPATNARARPRRREVWEQDEEVDARARGESLITLPAPHKTFFSFIRALLLTPAPPPAEAPGTPISPHEFIESLHVPRIYKAYQQELSDVCRDFFWVFCHPGNAIWNLDDTDEGKVEKPRAPGGMTGGVEFEAMGYLTTHFRLINAIAKGVAELNLAKEHELSAHRFHADLFASGLERTILIARKASTTYYPTLHLEIARYVALAGRARFELPWTLSRLVGPPPAGMCMPGRTPKKQERVGGAGASPTKRANGVGGRSGTPKLPTPQKVEPIRL